MAVRYTLFTNQSVRRHTSAPTWLLCDIDDRSLDRLLVEARIRSGDYFVTLAGELEKIAHLLGTDNPESQVLENIGEELMYLEKHYSLRPKA